MSQKLTTEEFIEKAINKHGLDRYDYSLVKYINARTYVTILCKIHGEFYQVPNSHLHGSGCPLCGALTKAKSRANTLDFFISAANIKHNNIYDYSKTIYINNRTTITIICPIHGDFEQTPADHLSGCGCQKCAGRNRTTNEFINQSNLLHNFKFDYNKTLYIDSKTPLTIICPIHGEFKQSPSSHLSGYGCYECRNVMSKEEYILKAINKHGSLYNYDKVKYLRSTDKIEIICQKHGSFFQQARNHLHGQGCPWCNESKGEKLINKFLSDNAIIFKRQYSFYDCKNIRLLPFDFGIIKDNKILLIEYQGEQHFKPINFGGTSVSPEQLFIDVKKRDNIKLTYSTINKIPLLQISYKKLKNIDIILTQFLKEHGYNL